MIVHSHTDNHSSTHTCYLYVYSTRYIVLVHSTIYYVLVRGTLCSIHPVRASEYTQLASYTQGHTYNHVLFCIHALRAHSHHSSITRARVNGDRSSVQVHTEELRHCNNSTVETGPDWTAAFVRVSTCVRQESLLARLVGRLVFECT